MAAHDSSDDPSPAKVAGTAAFSKFMAVLQLVADLDEPTSIADLARRSGFPRATVYRIAAALVAEGMLREDARDGRVSLGPRLIQLASRSWARSDLRLAATEALKALRDITGETVHLAVRNGNAMIYIEKLESVSAVRMASRIGTVVSLHSSAVGKAYLSCLGPGAREDIVGTIPLPAYTEHTITDRDALRAQIGRFETQGWAVDEEENEAGIYCFGAAIRDPRDPQRAPLAAISISTLRFRQKPDVASAYIEPLLATCRDIERRIGETPAFNAERDI